MKVNGVQSVNVPVIPHERLPNELSASRAGIIFHQSVYFACSVELTAGIKQGVRGVPFKSVKGAVKDRDDVQVTILPFVSRNFTLTHFQLLR